MFLHFITRWRQSTEYTSIPHLDFWRELTEQMPDLKPYAALYKGTAWNMSYHYKKRKTAADTKGSDCSALFYALSD